MEEDNNMSKLIKLEKSKGMYLFWCPGCQCAHSVWTENEGHQHPIWNWNKDLEKPTVSPSILVNYRHPKGYSNENHAPIGYKGEYDNDVCHSFVRDGKIQYLADCTHELAGKTVDMVDWDDV